MQKKRCTSLLIFDWLILTVDICGQISRNVGLCGRCSLPLPLPLCATTQCGLALTVVIIDSIEWVKQIWCNLAKMCAMLNCLNTLGFNSMILSCSLHLKDDDILNWFFDHSYILHYNIVVIYSQLRRFQL